MALDGPNRNETVSAGDDTAVHRGSGNFLADQGIVDTQEFRVKAHLCHEIASILVGRKLTPERAAEIVGVSESDVSRISNSLVDDYSVWKLMKVLAALGSDVVIRINPAGDEPGVILSERVKPQVEDISEAQREAAMAEFSDLPDEWPPWIMTPQS
jgi:predicted XRE-type DNA-binding protein